MLLVHVRLQAFRIHAFREAPTPLERGETLTYLCTLSSPLPLVAAAGAAAPAVHLNQLRVPTPEVRGSDI